MTSILGFVTESFWADDDAGIDETIMPNFSLI